MKSALCVLAVLAAMRPCMAADSISVPWEELKKLYRDAVEREVMEKIVPKTPPSVHTIEEALYDLAIEDEKGRGKALLTGTLLSGTPEPIPLFDDTIAITRIESVKGGSLISTDRGAARVAFLPEKQGPFQVAVGFLVPLGENKDSLSVSFRIPVSLRNSVTLTLPKGMSVRTPPGIADRKGTYHFSSARSLTVRLSPKREETRPSIISVEMKLALYYREPAEKSMNEKRETK
jgi:hypothetical protein